MKNSRKRCKLFWDNVGNI